MGESWANNGEMKVGARDGRGRVVKRTDDNSGAATLLHRVHKAKPLFGGRTHPSLETLKDPIPLQPSLDFYKALFPFRHGTTL